MAATKNPFGDVFKVKDDDVFSELDENKNTEISIEPKRNQTTTKKGTMTKETMPYKKYSLYLTPEQHTALKLLAVQSNNPLEKDISAIVRLAIDKYFKKE